jgi:quercetin dioxygenase-like cupin family protein
MSDFPPFLDRLPELDVDLPGFSGRLLQAAAHQVAFMRFDEEVTVPEHSHGEQWELVVAGEVALTVEGETRTYRVGESFHIPAGTPHAAVVRAGYRGLAVFDQPDRYQAR